MKVSGMDLNPTLDGGWWIPPPPLFLICGASQSDLRGTKFWYNSYFIVTMDIQKVENLKGVPIKIQSAFLEAGAKNQKFKFEL